MHPQKLLCLVCTVLAAALSACGASELTADDEGIDELDSAVVANLARPFDMPSPSTLRASPKKVFAHYVSWFPRSIDNREASLDYYARHYLHPEGENGKYVSVGGKMRDRPTTRPVSADPDWRLLDMKADVREAISSGIDGFIISMVQMSGQWARNTDLLLRAAREVDPGFKILLRPNMISFSSTEAGALAAYMAKLGDSSSAYRLSDGRLVISPFMAEKWSVSKWKTFFSIMKSSYGESVAFWPMFLNERTWGETFDPISYGMANWGERSPRGNDPTLTHSTSKLGRIATMKAMGQKWMQPVSFTDARPAQGIYDEAENTTNLRNSWEIAIKGDSDAVHLVTWNDYAEGSAFGTTPRHGWSVLDISAYYTLWFKTGKPPAIVRDGVYLTHRIQTVAARPTYPQTKFMTLRSGSSPARDTVEALTFLKAPARVTVKVGSNTYTCDAKAGVDTCTVPLSVGSVSARVERNGAVVASVASPHKVTSRPYVQDFDYVALSSGRDGVTAVEPPAEDSPTTPPGDSGATASIIKLHPINDAYVYEGAPTTNYKTSSFLASRGNLGHRAFLKFDLPAAPAGKRLVAARLRFRTTDHSYSGSSVGHVIRFASNSWSSSTLTWNQQPAIVSGSVGAIAAGTEPGRTYETWVSPAALTQKGDSHITLAISNTTGSPEESLWFWSSDASNADHRPMLSLTYK